MDSSNTRVFFSYARMDRQFVSRLTEALEEEDGIDVLGDPVVVLPVEGWAQRLEDRISEADTVVFVLSPRSAASDACEWEIEFAESLNKRIQPIVIGDVEDSQIPRALKKYDSIVFAEDDDFDEAFAALVESLVANIDWVRTHTRLGIRARRWDAQRNLGSLPLDREELREASDWLKQKPEDAPEPTELHLEYLAFSRPTALMRQKNWTRGSLVAAALAMVVAGLAYNKTHDALVQRDQAVERRNVAVAEEKKAKENLRIVQANEQHKNEERERADRERTEAEKNFEIALTAAESLVTETTKSMQSAKGVPVADIRAMLEKSEKALHSLKGVDATSAGRRRRAVMLHSFIDAYVAIGRYDLAFHRASLAVETMEDLVSENPGNVQWQHDLALSFKKLGNVHTNQGDLTGALASHLHGLDILERIAQADRSNPKLQHDLAIAYDNAGNVMMAQGNLNGALASYNDGLASFERLAASDPRNEVWQHGLSVGHSKLAVVHLRLKNDNRALKELRAGRTIAQNLLQVSPEHVRWKRDLAWFDGQIGALSD